MLSPANLRDGCTCELVAEGARAGSGSLATLVWARSGATLRLRAASGLEHPLIQLALEEARAQVPGFDPFTLALELGSSPSAQAIIQGGLPLLAVSILELVRESNAPPSAAEALGRVLAGHRITAYPLMARGQPQCVVCYLQPEDRVWGARRAMEICTRQLAPATAACRVREETQALGTSEMARSEFLSAVAHELKTPISYVKNAAGLLRHERYRHDSSMVAELTQTIEQGMSRLNRRVDGLLSLAGAAPGPPVEAWGLGPLVREGVESVCALAEARQQALAVALPPTPIYGWVHAERYLAALQNVLDNAVKYTPPGGRLSVQLRAAGNKAVALVSDSGPGIPRELWERVFDPFFRHLPKAASGLGLGLPIARSCLRAMGGGLWVERSSVQGTTFALAVGAAEAASQP